MFCPRCGAENEKKSRYCNSCGAGLRKRSQGLRGVTDRLAALVGGSRRERLLTLATALALAVAVVAFIALDFDDSDVPDAGQTAAADDACIAAKARVAAAATRGQAAASGGINTYGVGIVVASLDFRDALRAQNLVGTDAEVLDRALRDAAIEAGALARLGREGAARGEIDTQAERVNVAFGQVDEGIKALGLQRCSAVGITPAGERDASQSQGG